MYVFQEKGKDELQKSSSSRLQAFVMDVAKTTSVTQGYELVKQYIPEDAGMCELCFKHNIVFKRKGLGTA